MKKIASISAVILFAFCSSIAAQTPQLPAGKPTGQPGKVQLPTPAAVKTLAPADLVITDLHLVGASFDNNNKWCVVKISLTIKNTGGLSSARTDIRPMASKGSGAAWNNMGSYAILIGLRPNQSWTGELTFTDKQQIVSPRNGYDFKVVVDSNRQVAESDENNNTSAVIHVTGIQ